MVDLESTCIFILSARSHSSEYLLQCCIMNVVAKYGTIIRYLVPSFDFYTRFLSPFNEDLHTNKKTRSLWTSGQQQQHLQFKLTSLTTQEKAIVIHRPIAAKKKPTAFVASCCCCHCCGCCCCFWLLSCLFSVSSLLLETEDFFLLPLPVRLLLLEPEPTKRISTAVQW